LKRRFNIERIPGPLAPLYEKASRLAIKSYYSQVAEEILSTFRRGLLLDLGTGPGYLPIELAKRAPALRIIGIDLSRPLIRRARANALRAECAERLHFEVGNAANLRFGSESFDGVVSTGMLHALRDPARVLRECWRVLKPGQEVWIYDPARVSSQIDKEKWKASFSLFERFMYIALLVYVRLDPPKTVTEGDALQMIRSTPFKDFRIVEKGGELELRLRKTTFPQTSPMGKARARGLNEPALGSTDAG
jgi:ubiquinone/menaquinone biosynthesis C-methylase UbiE